MTSYYNHSYCQFSKMFCQKLANFLYCAHFVWLQAAVISRHWRSANLLQYCKSWQLRQCRRQVAARGFSLLSQGAHHTRRHKEGLENWCWCNRRLVHEETETSDDGTRPADGSTDTRSRLSRVFITNPWRSPRSFWNCSACSTSQETSHKNQMSNFVILSYI